MNTSRNESGGGLVPASRSVPVVTDSSEMRDWAEQLVARARSEGIELTGDNGLLTAMVRQVLQTGLNVELAEHLGYEPYASEGRGSGNNRNGSYPKTITTEIGQVDIDMPRDRLGTFEPATIPKHTRRLDGVSGNVISLYAKEMTTGDIQTHLAEIYGTEISRETISKITDQIVEDMQAWQHRPLDSVYAVLLIDCIVVKIRGSQVANRPVYVAIGVNMDGERDVLGLSVGPSVGEGAKQWATMLNELRNRGLADALIVCCDGLKGLPESIRATWPEATVQTCVVHLVRKTRPCPPIVHDSHLPTPASRHECRSRPSLRRPHQTGRRQPSASDRETPAHCPCGRKTANTASTGPVDEPGRRPNSPKARNARKLKVSGHFISWRGQDLNLRPSGYE